MLVNKKLQDYLEDERGAKDFINERTAICSRTDGTVRLCTMDDWGRAHSIWLTTEKEKQTVINFLSLSEVIKNASKTV